LLFWKDAGAAGFQGTGTDTQVTLAATPVYASSTTFAITPASVPTITASDIYYVVLKSDTSGVTNNNAFTLGIGASGIVTSSSSPTISALTTQTITIDTVAPTLNTTTSGPANGAANVPVSTFMSMFFSENMDFSTMTPSNITFTTGGTPIGAAIKSMPGGFNLIVSSPPVYATSSIFSKVANAVFGFFFIPPSGTFYPQGGTYLTPAAGDIVYFQHETFPAELGIVTNATLAGGTFTVNNFSIFGGQAIAKFATATATGAVTAATSLTLGDLFIANTTAAPATDRYAWHMVTTAAAVNSADLRLDGATARPTYVGSSNFSQLTPTDTSAVNGTSQVVGSANSGINFVVGDLIFAKVIANADNLGSYAWHIVTTAQNITTDAAPSTLRLDDSTGGAPTFAPTSQVSKLTPGATGAVTESATTFSYGDLVFAKTNANAGTNNAYAFHFVSNGATGANSTSLRFDNVTANLGPSTIYVITLGTGLKDKAGNAFAGGTVTFTTGSNSGTNTTPPFISSTNPQTGNQSFPLNAALRVQFSVPMAITGAGSVTNSANIGIFTDNFGAPGTQVTAVNTYDSSTNTAIVTPSVPLTASTNYILKVNISTTSATTTPLLSPFFLNFRTSSATDVAPPTVLGIFPAKLSSDPGSGNGTTSLDTAAVSIGFSEDMDPATITGSTITVTGGGAAGTVTYTPSSRTANFSFSSPLVADTLYTVTVVSGGSGVKDLVGNALATNYTSTFRTNSTADTVQPSVSFGGADNFGVAVTFSKAMKIGVGPNAIDNIANYTLESPTGSSISLAGQTVIYDGPTMTAKISGLALQYGNTFKVTVSNLVKDISGNFILTTGTPALNTASGTVANATTTGGSLGPGGGGGGFQPPTGTGNYTPVNVNPMSRLAGATTGYMVQFPVTTSVPLGGSIVLTFPMGFDVTNVAASTAGTESFSNTDINGPLTGTVTIASVTPNVSARTITVVTAGAATGVSAFVGFDLKGIINTTVPSSTGYTVDIKTKDDAGVILQTQTSAPFNIGAAGSNTLTVNVTKSTVGLANVVVFLSSPAIGGTQATTNGSGVATFSNLSSGDYQIGINPSSLVSSSVVFNSAPQNITISGNTTKNYALDTAPYTISGTITGTSGDKVDVFASSQNGYIKTTKTLTGGADAYSLPVQGNMTYNVGVGPAIPDSFQQAGSNLPPPPTFSFIPPPNIQVIVAAASVAGKNFTLTTTNRTITGTVTDSAGNGLNGVQLFARPAENSTTGGSTVGMGKRSDRFQRSIYAESNRWHIYC